VNEKFFLLKERSGCFVLFHIYWYFLGIPYTLVDLEKKHK